MVNRITVLAAMLALSGIALANGNGEGQLKLRPGMMGIIDIGATDCATFSEMHYNGPSGMRHHVLTWAQGYIYAKTGANIETMLEALSADNGWDFDSLSDIFVDYCEASPDSKVAEAAIAVYTTLKNPAT